MPIISKKICLVGDSGVGKTSLIRRFVKQRFSDQYLSTVGAKISRKALESVNLQLLIWDLEGNTNYRAITPSYLQGGSGAVVVADVSRQETINRLPEHIDLFLSINPKSSIIVVLNKSDLIEEEELKQWMQWVQIKKLERVSAIYKASAKTGTSVAEIFQQLTCKILEFV